MMGVEDTVDELAIDYTSTMGINDAVDELVVVSSMFNDEIMHLLIYISK